jgi:adenosylhomocysteine nucleosidase
VIAFITGLRQEARLLAGFEAFVGGGTPKGAERAARQAIAAGATALVSFGVAGGLDPRLRAGDIVRPGGVWWRGACYQADAALTAALGGETARLIATTAAPVASVGQKNALRGETGAAAVDLETGPVAALAANHNLPFAALRAICDIATQELPGIALTALDPAGGIVLHRVFAGLLRRPGQVAALLALGRNAARARQALGRETALFSRHETLASFG